MMADQIGQMQAQVSAEVQEVAQALEALRVAWAGGQAANDGHGDEVCAAALVKVLQLAGIPTLQPPRMTQGYDHVAGSGSWAIGLWCNRPDRASGRNGGRGAAMLATGKSALSGLLRR